MLNKSQIKNYALKSKFLLENGWQAIGHIDNWRKGYVSKEDGRYVITEKECSTDVAYNKCIENNETNNREERTNWKNNSKCSNAERKLSRYVVSIYRWLIRSF